MTENKPIDQYTGDELVKIVSASLECPICGKECENQNVVYAHISAEHPPAKGAAS